MMLKTARLTLREFDEEDWRAVLAYQSHPQHLRYYDWTERTEADVRAFVQMFVGWQNETPRTRFQLAMVLNSTQELIGNCGIRINNPEWREANIGYELDNRYWSRGYATEAAGAILKFGFDQLGMHRIWAWCVADNAGSARVLEKIGMRLEGRKREKELIKGQWHDRLIYAMLDHEWRQP